MPRLTDTERLEWVADHYVKFSSRWQGDWPLDEQDFTVCWTEFRDLPTYKVIERRTTVHGTDFRVAIDEAMRQDSRRNGITPPKHGL